MIAYKFHLTSKSGEDYRFVRWAETQEEMNKIVKQTKIRFDEPWYQIYYDIVDNFKHVKDLPMEAVKNNTIGEMMELQRLIKLHDFSLEDGEKV